jgi:hypothetical protein
MDSAPFNLTQEKIEESFSKIDALAKYLYNNANPIEVDINEYARTATNWKPDNEREADFFDLLLFENSWFQYDEANGLFGLTESGKNDYEIYGSYTEYQKASKDFLWYRIQKKKDKFKEKKRKNKFKYIIKNTSSVVAILLSLSTLLVTIISIFDKRELRSLEQEVKQLRAGQDTLIQRLNSPKIQANKLPQESIPAR